MKTLIKLALSKVSWRIDDMSEDAEKQLVQKLKSEISQYKWMNPLWILLNKQLQGINKTLVNAKVNIFGFITQIK